MDKIQFVDQTIRDAQQSLWGNMMRTDHILPVAEKMDKVGYLAIATVGSQAFTVAVRNLGELGRQRPHRLSSVSLRFPVQRVSGADSREPGPVNRERRRSSVWCR